MSHQRVIEACGVGSKRCAIGEPGAVSSTAISVGSLMVTASRTKNSLTVLHLPTLTERETSTLMGGPNCPYDGATGAVRIMGFAGSLFAAIMVHAGCVRTFRVVVDDEGLLDSQFR